MTLTTTSLAELQQRQELAMRRFVEIVAEVPPDTPVNDGTWTVRQVAAHVLTVTRRYTQRDIAVASGLSATFADLHAQNQTDVDAIGDRSTAELIEDLETEQQHLLALQLDPDATYPFHFDQRIDGLGGWGNLIGELLVHGYDVARAGGRPWTIEPRDAVLVLNGVFQVAPGALNRAAVRDLTAAFEFRVAGERPQTLLIDRGTARIVDSAGAPGRPDVVLGGPPVPVLLNLYGRLGAVRAGFRGVRIRGGRRPWLGLRLASLFDS